MPPPPLALRRRAPVALNSYENRVYQLAPARLSWCSSSTAAAAGAMRRSPRSHQFTRGAGGGRARGSLARSGGNAVPLPRLPLRPSPGCRGHSPELDAPEARQMLAAASRDPPDRRAARLPRSGPASACRGLGWDARRAGARERAAAAGRCASAIPRSAAHSSSASARRLRAGRGTREIRLHGDCHLGNLLWNEHGPVFVDLDDAPRGYACKDLWMMLRRVPRRTAARVGRAAGRLRAVRGFDFSGIAPSSSRCAAYACCTMLPGWAHRWSDPAFPARLSLGRRAALLGGATSMIAEQIPAIDEPPLLQL